MDSTTARMVDFAMQLATRPLSPELALACKRSLIDAFGCMLGAFGSPQAHMARKLADGYRNTTPAASVWGCRWSTSLEMAAFANGTMVRLLDLSDTYTSKGGGHPSDTISALVAAAEAAHASGPQLMRSVALAYEVYCGCADAVDLNRLGWDQPTYGAGAAALGAGLLLGLEGEQLAHAFAIATASSLALMQTRYGALSSWKNSAGANASRNGVFAAQLARAGFTGPDAVLEGKFGLFKVVSPFDWRLPASAAETLRIGSVNFKNFPCCYHGQASVWAALQVRESGLRPAQIRDVMVEVHPKAIALMADAADKWAPTTPETADHSLPFVVATALAYGQLDGNSFRQERLTDPVLLDMMRTIRVQPAADLANRFPKSMGARLTVIDSVGSSHAAYVPSAPGHADNPMNQSTLDNKFLKLADGVCSREAAHAFLSEMWNLEQVKDFRATVAILSDSEALAKAS